MTSLCLNITNILKNLNLWPYLRCNIKKVRECLNFQIDLLTGSYDENNHWLVKYLCLYT